MRDKRLLDIEGVDEHLPSRVVDAEDSLMLLDILLPVIGHAVGLFGDYSRISERVQ